MLWRGHSEFDEELAHLPQTSAAEFRREAWTMWQIRWQVQLHYIPLIGVRGVAAMITAVLTITFFGGFFDTSSTSLDLFPAIVGFFLAGSVTAILTISKTRSNLRYFRRRRRNRRLIERSQQIDQMVTEGTTPAAPQDWDGPLPARLE